DASAENRSHLVIQSIIAQLNQFNPNRRIYGQDATEWVDIGNATTTNDITYTSKYKTSIEMIEEVSGDQYTGNGQYIYFVQYNPRSSTTTSTTSNKLVDSTASFVSTLAGLTVYNNTDGTSTTISAVDSATQLSLSSDIFTSGEDYIIPTYDLHWKAKPLSVTGSLTEGVEPSEIKVGKSVDGVINVVIYNAGLDPHGNGMEFLNYDFTISGTGSRWKYVSQTSTIGADIVKAEFEADTSLWDTTSDGNRIGNFPSSGSYSYTMQFEDRDSSGVKTGVLAVAANDNDFNDLVRNESKWQGRGRTDQIIRRFSNPRFKCTKFIPYSEASEYVLGDIYTLTIPSFGLSAKKLRLMQLDYEFWGVQLQFEEDETTILEAEL
ncbi:MAG: hypothetical protein KAT00_14525, partial [Planctomycetes bacterium]|nr:hypothetical protein [Planctomycetota bacterium]